MVAACEGVAGVDGATVTAVLDAPDVLWRPHVQQARFLSNPAFEVLGGGQAGGGKSDCVIAAPLRFVHNGNHSALIIRRTFPELQELMDRADELYPQLGAKWEAQEKRYRFPSGAKVRFGHAEDGYRTIRKLYHGAQFNDLGVDELTLFDEEKAWTYLLSRLRTTDPTLMVQARATTNPGGPGHAWVKRRFVDQCRDDGKPLTITHKDGLTTTRAFVRFGLKDNPSLTTNDPQYVARLQLLPELERRQMEEGDWDAGASTFFSEITTAVHLVKPFEIPPHWHRWGGHDWGYSHPWVFIDAAKDPQGRVYLVNTIWGRRNADEVIAERIVAAQPRAARPDYLLRCGGDVFHEQKARRDSTYTTSDTYRAWGLTPIKMGNAPGSRKRGAANLRRMTRYRKTDTNARGQKVDGIPLLRAFDTPGNRWLLAQLQAMVSDPSDPEDVLKIDWVEGVDEFPQSPDDAPPGDDGYDAVRAVLSIATPTVTEPEGHGRDHDRMPDRTTQRTQRRGEMAEPQRVVVLPPVTMWTQDDSEDVRV